MNQFIIAASISVACFVSPNSALAEPLKGLNFDRSDAQAIVIVEESTGIEQGEVHFLQVDTQSRKTGKVKFKINKNLWFGARMPTIIPELQTSGESIYKTKSSRFSGAKKPKGEFALVKYMYSTERGRLGLACLPHGVPVYRFKPGMANLISAEILPNGGPSDGNRLFGLIDVSSAKYPALGSDIEDAQKVLNENSGIKTDVVLAELLGIFAFKSKSGKFSSCTTQDEIVPISEAPTINN
jgi:hypothetical protein